MDFSVSKILVINISLWYRHINILCWRSFSFSSFLPKHSTMVGSAKYEYKPHHTNLLHSFQWHLFDLALSPLAPDYLRRTSESPGVQNLCLSAALTEMLLRRRWPIALTSMPKFFVITWLEATTTTGKGSGVKRRLLTSWIKSTPVRIMLLVWFFVQFFPESYNERLLDMIDSCEFNQFTSNLRLFKLSTDFSAIESKLNDESLLELRYDRIMWI